MEKSIILPQVTSFELTGFKPIFSETISASMSEGAFVILGGNGIGKTTLIQSVVYGLAGGLSSDIEDTKVFRWNHTFFKERLDHTQEEQSTVEVFFRLGENSVGVRRGFRGDNITSVKINDDEWVSEDADTVFGENLRRFGGYRSIQDFAFVVHRLLYLPENRRLIAWDTEAQVRLIMIINQDLIRENEFRENRAQLKKLDSKKRHIHVAIGKAEKEIETLIEYEENDDDEEEEREEFENSGDDLGLPSLVESLQRVASQRYEVEDKLQESLAELGKISKEIAVLREEIEDAEAGVVANFVKETERGNDLALEKLINSKICPACGERHSNLAAQAQRYLREHKCVLCGTDEPRSGAKFDFDATKEKLQSLLRQQDAFEEIVNFTTEEKASLESREIEIQGRVNTVRYSRSIVSMVERNLPEMTLENLRTLNERLIIEEADAAAQIERLKTKLEKDYDEFNQKVNERIGRFRGVYAKHATAFLGLPCELVEIEEGGHLDLSLFVPAFGGVTRQTERSCSEAQRFFLDIAFRLALIETAGTSKGTATFFCETPETALDLSYVTNVVEMFNNFTSGGNNVLLSANIQIGGIAEEILTGIPVDEREKHLLNLLDLGRLSEVQEQARDKFDEIVNRMLAE